MDEVFGAKAVNDHNYNVLIKLFQNLMINQVHCRPCKIGKLGRIPISGPQKILMFIGASNYLTNSPTIMCFVFKPY